MEREFKTTFFQDLTIADKFWKEAVEETCIRAFNEWKNDYRYLTELIVAMNRKIWEHHEENQELAELYNHLWQKADLRACENLKDDELDYYYRQTD